MAKKTPAAPHEYQFVRDVVNFTLNATAIVSIIGGVISVINSPTIIGILIFLGSMASAALAWAVFLALGYLERIANAFDKTPSSALAAQTSSTPAVTP